jgi:uncharacterized membrane protein YecN with MAPEG domain
MPVAVVSFYAGLNALLALVLAINVSRHREMANMMLGHGGHASLEQAQRAHGNLMEYGPIILLLLLLLALTGVAALWLHGLGIALTIARLLHAWGMLTARRRSFGRFVGIIGTWIVMLVAAVLAIVQGFAAL